MAANRRDDAAPESGRRTPMRIRTHLIILVVGALLPVLAFSAIMTVVSWLQQRATFEQQFLERVRGMTIALDRELEGFIRALQGLATAPELEADDLAAFYRRARRMLATQPAWSTLVVADASGTQSLNLRRPLGEALPPLEDDDTFRRVKETRQPAVSPLIRAPLTGQYVTRVGVPVMPHGVVAYVLFASIDQPVWLEFLKSSPIAPDATMTLLDQNRIVLARTLNAERWIGQRPSPVLYEKAGASPEAAYRNVGLEGQWFYTAHSRSRVSGWTLATGVPVEGVEAALRGSTMAMAAGAVAAVLVALSLALVFGRGIAGPVTSLAGAAKALATGRPAVQARSSAVAEVQEVARAFDEAGALLRDREAAVSEALERERQARLEVERALAERARLLEDAEAANRAKDQFLAMLGHELRNPLSAIGAALAVLDRADPAGEPAGRARAVVHRQVTQLSRLVDDLLDVARVSTGKVLLSRAALDLGALVTRSLATLTAGGRTERHRLEVETESVWVDADEARLEQIVTNLVGNALKYTPAGGTIRVLVRREGDRAVLQVADTGVGIPSHVIGRVFDLFVQGDRSIDRSQGGLGVGLTLVRRLVEMHGGEVEAASPGAGAGSVFTVRLPAVSGPDPRPPARSSRPSHARRRVLVVEDNADARQMLRAALELHGHDVHEAEDGPSGVAAARALRPEVVLVDIGLPGLDGYEVARRIRADGAHEGLVLIALTGYGQPEDRRRSMDAGFDAHLVKPIDPPVLAEIIARADRARPEERT